MYTYEGTKDRSGWSRASLLTDIYCAQKCVQTAINLRIHTEFLIYIFCIECLLPLSLPRSSLFLSVSLFLSLTPYLSLLSLSWSTSVSVLLLILSLLLSIFLPHKRATWFSYDSSYEFSSFLFLYSSCGSSTATELFRVALGTHLWIRERAEMIPRTKLWSVKMSALHSISRLFFKITFFANVMKYILLKIFDQFLYTYLTLSYDRKRKEHLKYADLI